jgi:hypothetical protein
MLRLGLAQLVGRVAAGAVRDVPHPDRLQKRQDVGVRESHLPEVLHLGQLVERLGERGHQRIDLPVGQRLLVLDPLIEAADGLLEPLRAVVALVVDKVPHRVLQEFAIVRQRGGLTGQTARAGRGRRSAAAHGERHSAQQCNKEQPEGTVGDGRSAAPGRVSIVHEKLSTV